MTKEEILDYVTNTPENTNRLVLNDMIDELINAAPSGSGATIVPLTKSGGGGGAISYTSTVDAQTLWAAANSGPVIFKVTATEADPADEVYALTYAEKGTEIYMFYISSINSGIELGAGSGSDYPSTL
jgi:hypothetical protein